jgi:hypothetical protein
LLLITLTGNLFNSWSKSFSLRLDDVLFVV